MVTETCSVKKFLSIDQILNQLSQKYCSITVHQGIQFVDLSKIGHPCEEKTFVEVAECREINHF